MKKFLYFLWDIVKIVAIAIIIVVPIRYFVFQPFFVRGASMEPNFENGNYLIIDEISQRFYDYQRGEVIVFRFPNDPSQFYIKRIIGLPSEEIEIQEGEIKISNKDNPEGFVLDESFYLSDSFTPGNLRISLKSNEYFVLGDNRYASSDSRRWGTVSRKNIIGKAFLRAWPIDEFQLIERPGY